VACHRAPMLRPVVSGSRSASIPGIDQQVGAGMGTDCGRYRVGLRISWTRWVAPGAAEGLSFVLPGGATETTGSQDAGVYSSGRGNGVAEVHPGAFMSGARWSRPEGAAKRAAGSARRARSRGAQPGRAASRPPHDCDPCTIGHVQTADAQPIETFPAPDLAGMDAPVRRLFERIAPELGAGTPDMAAIAAAMIELASDRDYLVGRIRTLGPGGGAAAIHAPERGPRLTLVHRPEGRIGAIHDHGCWVGLAPVTGIETHRHFRLLQGAAELARLELATERAVAAGQAVTMLAPDDIHSHGHVAGSGEPAYVLIMTGDNQRVFRRTEWDTPTGRSRVLEPGDMGRWIDSEPFVDASDSG
jgi:hypothetical protein